MSETTLRRLPDAVAGTAREIYPHDAVEGTGCGIAQWFGGPKDGNDRRTNGRREVHRTRVAGNEKRELLQDRSRQQQAVVGGGVDEESRRNGGLKGCDETAIGR